ncbi:MAG: DUF4388 domain-containing protein [Acidobacteria bacterium]|nr:DUF4388 domain-containing protein [Acidobacteriota bacterium]
MGDNDFIYRGNLSRTVLAEMLATIHRHGVPGVMEFTRAEETRKLYFIDGDIIFATSSDRGMSLGDYLVGKGRITEAQHQVSSEELARAPGRRHGSILIQMGFLRKEELGAVVREQVQDILWGLFNWDEGEVVFNVGVFREDEVYKIKVPTPRAILSGCKHIADAKMVMGKLGGRSTVFSSRPRPDHLEKLHLETSEMAMLEAVDGQMTLFDLCEKGPLNPGVNARMMYAFMFLQLVKREEVSSSGIRIQVKNTDP